MNSHLNKVKYYKPETIINDKISRKKILTTEKHRAITQLYISLQQSQCMP